MNKVPLKKQTVKKRSLLLTFLVLFSLFMSSENVFAQNFFTKSSVTVIWYPQANSVLVQPKVFDYAPGSGNGYLKKFEIKVSNGFYFETLACLSTERKSLKDGIVLNISFLKNDDLFEFDFDCLASKGAKVQRLTDSKAIITVPNDRVLATLAFKWHKKLGSFDIKYVEISGKWNVDAPYKSEIFEDFIYRNSSRSMLKSNVSDINTKVSTNDSVKVFKDSEAIVINGAKPGSNIKVYTTSGGEIKSKISYNDVVKIDVPANQIYLVHVGKSRHKVAM